ncbi:ClbS/DfsB family four-helix bundle protein [Helicobacter sp. 23-1046]
MPRPRNKDELLQAMRDEFAKLLGLIQSASNDVLERDFARPLRDNARDKNARDVLIHLYEWHTMLEDFIINNVEREGERFTQKPEIAPFLPPPYNWRTYPQLNVEIWQKHQSTSLQDALDSLQSSHNRIINLAEQFSNDELFGKGHFSFTGTNALASYMISSTSSHYAWATKQLKMGLKDKT